VRTRRDEREAPPARATNRSATSVAVLLLLTALVGGYFAWSGYRERNAARSVEAYCQQLPNVRNLDQALGSLDPRAVDTTLPKLEALAAVSPPEIEPQVRTVLDTSRSLVDALGKAGKDDGEALREVWRTKQQELQQIADAGRALERYSLEKCNVALQTVPG
jgi:hypothetical protein